MLLKISRSQRKGMMGKIIFALDIRADYSQEERDNINRYNLGGEVVYSSEAAKSHAARAQEGGLGSALWNIALANMNLNVTIASLSKGHHIECKNLNELLECEQALREACKNVTSWLDAAATFDGRELIVEYRCGEERLREPRPVG